VAVGKKRNHRGKKSTKKFKHEVFQPVQGVKTRVKEGGESLLSRQRVNQLK